MGLLLTVGQFAAVFFSWDLIKPERVRLIDQPRGRDISRNFDVASRGTLYLCKVESCVRCVVFRFVLQ